MTTDSSPLAERETTMSDHGTSSEEIPGWYLTLQTDVLTQLPRPHELSKETALAWHGRRFCLKASLRNALCVDAAEITKMKPRFPTWMNLVIGGVRRSQLLQMTMTFDKAARLLNAIPMLHQQTEVKLVKLRTSDLGFGTRAATLAVIFERVKRLGLDLVQEEAGIYLWLESFNQSEKRLLMGMHPLAIAGVGPSIFCIDRAADGTRILTTTALALNGTTWDDSHTWVFQQID